MANQENEQRLSGLKQRLEQLRSFKDRCDERINLGLQQLSSHGCGNVQDAEALHATLLKEIPVLQTKYDGLLNKAGEVLNGVEVKTGQSQTTEQGRGQVSPAQGAPGRYPNRPLPARQVRPR